MRLDVYVSQQHPGVSRAYIQKQIEAGLVLVNGKPAQSSHKLKPTDNIDIRFDLASITIVDIELPIIYEDSDCVVIDKPAGVLTHSKGAYNPEATVASWVQKKYYSTTPEPIDNSLPNNREGIVHRLDRATSGVMICAKTEPAQKWLQKQFSQRRVKKTYCAITRGHLKLPEAIIDIPIERNPNKPQTFRANQNGKPAQTHYKVIKSTGLYSLLELKPTTGRTHQLRVHLAHLEHPIVGDSFYGGESADRLYLHSLSLELTLPNRTRQTFSSPLPKNFLLKMGGDK